MGIVGMKKTKKTFTLAFVHTCEISFVLQFINRLRMHFAQTMLNEPIAYTNKRACMKI